MSKANDRKCEFNDLDNNIENLFIAAIAKGDLLEKFETIEI